MPRVDIQNFRSESEVAIGLSSGKVEVWRIEKGNNNRDVGVKVSTFEAHSTRIKGMAVCQGLLFTGDSSGLVCAFDKTGKKLLEQETKARITCLSVSVEMEENGNDQEMPEIKEETTTKLWSTLSLSSRILKTILLHMRVACCMMEN